MPLAAGSGEGPGRRPRAPGTTISSTSRPWWTLEVLQRSGLKVVVDVLYGTGRDYLDAFLERRRSGGGGPPRLSGPLFRRAPAGALRRIPPELRPAVRPPGRTWAWRWTPTPTASGSWTPRGVSRSQHHPGPAVRLSHRDPGLGRGRGPQRRHHPPDRPGGQPYGRPVFETKVGFKHLGQYIISDQAIMVGEESEGFSMKHHLPEKDGILAWPDGGRNGGPDRQGPSRAHCRPVCPGGAGLQPPPQLLPDAGGQRAPDGAASRQRRPVCRLWPWPSTSPWTATSISWRTAVGSVSAPPAPSRWCVFTLRPRRRRNWSGCGAPAKP